MLTNRGAALSSSLDLSALSCLQEEQSDVSAPLMMLGCLALPSSAKDNILGRITVALATMYVPHVKF